MYAFTAIDHVGVAVVDLDAALAWYRERLGLELVHMEVNHDQGLVEAMLRAGPDDDGAQLQILAPERPDSLIAKFIDRSGPGMHHVAYRVDDVEAAAAGLREAGLHVLYDAARTGTAGSHINFIHPRDTGGVLLEIVERAVG